MESTDIEKFQHVIKIVQLMEVTIFLHKVLWLVWSWIFLLTQRAFQRKQKGTNYQDKLSIIGGVDPFSGCVGVLSERLPLVESIDIISYLVLWTSFVTAEQFKAQKGLEANYQFLNRWVKDVCTKQYI